MELNEKLEQDYNALKADYTQLKMEDIISRSYEIAQITQIYLWYKEHMDALLRIPNLVSQLIKCKNMLKEAYDYIKGLHDIGDLEQDMIMVCWIDKQMNAVRRKYIS